VEKLKVELASHMAATSVVEHVKVSEEEERAYYQEHQAQFQEEGKVSAKHILVDSKEQAEQVDQEVAAGLAFEEAAKKYSTCPSKDRGGDLGYFSKGQMVPEFEKAAFGGEVGTVIGPVETQFGHHLILVEDKKEPSQRSFGQAQEQIHQQLVQARQQEAYQAKVKELSEAYGVEHKGF